jgi:hypothetical protein
MSTISNITFQHLDKFGERLQQSLQRHNTNSFDDTTNILSKQQIVIERELNKTKSCGICDSTFYGKYKDIEYKCELCNTSICIQCIYRYNFYSK